VVSKPSLHRIDLQLTVPTRAHDLPSCQNSGSGTSDLTTGLMLMCVPSQHLSISGSVVTPGWLCVQDVKDHFKQAGHVLHADILQVGGWEGVYERASTAVSCKYPLFLTHHSLFADVAPCCAESRRQRSPR
jgi:hypothetical protein